MFIVLFRMTRTRPVDTLTTIEQRDTSQGNRTMTAFKTILLEKSLVISLYALSVATIAGFQYLSSLV